MKWVNLGILFIVFFSACNGHKVYDTFYHTPLSGWEKNDTLLFDVPRIQEKGNYQSDLALRINNAFPFMKMTLIIEQSVYPHHTVYRDTLNCDLIGSNGIPKGHGISYYEFEFPVAILHLEKGDSLHITVRHDMKREILPGISNIGIQLTKKK